MGVLLTRPDCGPQKQPPLPARRYANVQATVCGGARDVHDAPENAKRTKNASELQVAVMIWELALVEHESKFTAAVPDSVATAAVRAMLPQDIVERYLDERFNPEELRARETLQWVMNWWVKRLTSILARWTMETSTLLAEEMKTLPSRSLAGT